MLRQRILTAIVLLTVLLASAFWMSRIGWIVLVGVFVAAAAWEWAVLAGLRRIGCGVYAFTILAGGIWAGYAAGEGMTSVSAWLYGAAVVFWAVLVPVWLWERPAFANPLMPLAAGIAVLVSCAAAMVALRKEDPAVLLGIMAVVWISDVAAYFVGRRYGRNKLAPSISPGKTWEGVYGALAAVTIYALTWIALGGPEPAALRHVALGELWFVLLFLAFAAAGITGDLFESQMKRRAGMKDSGNLLPGHGGVLDRVDALLPVLPLAALVFTN